MSMPYAPVLSTRNRDAMWFVLAALIPLLGLSTALGMWIANPLRFNPKAVLHISGTRPTNGAKNVLPNAFIAADLHLPNKGHGVDASTISADAVKLYRASDKAPVQAVVNTSGAGDAIVLQPAGMLQPETAYTFEITSGLKDTGGNGFAPYTATFTTAAGATMSDYPVAFNKVPLGKTDGVVICLTLGPDGSLYAGTFDGRILRYGIALDGTLAAPRIISTIQQAN